MLPCFDRLEWYFTARQHKTKLLTQCSLLRGTISVPIESSLIRGYHFWALAAHRPHTHIGVAPSPPPPFPGIKLASGTCCPKRPATVSPTCIYPHGRRRNAPKKSVQDMTDAQSSRTHQRSGNNQTFIRWPYPSRSLTVSYTGRYVVMEKHSLGLHVSTTIHFKALGELCKA